MKKQQSLPFKKADDAKRVRILNAILPQVPFDGWTEKAYAQGLKEAGILRGEADMLFPQGVRDIVEFFGDVSDVAMEARVKDEPAFARLRVRDKITFCVRARLEFQTPYRDAVRRMMVWYALPTHLALGVKRLYRTVDVMWRCAGDTATDFNFYSKRLLLAGVLKTTVIVWLDDDTSECAATWAFLDRRIADVMRIGKSLSLLKEWKPSEWMGMLRRRMRGA